MPIYYHYILILCFAGPIPDNLAVVSTNSDSVTLTWSVPAQLDYYAVIYGYSVEYTSEHSGTKTYHSQSISTNPTVTIPALDPKIGYTFKVAVAFDPELANVGPYSKSIEKETDGIVTILCIAWNLHVYMQSIADEDLRVETFSFV